ncbi:MAG: VTT domain-containing protein [Caldilineaceae bacterium]|nr:VTT domain-containing protein [Caldilineaceae bacterium]
MTTHEQSVVRGAPLVQRHWPRLVALACWAVLAAGYLWYARTQDAGPEQLLALMRSGVFGPLVFIALFTLRPLIFFPASVLSVAGGLLFGLTGGLLYTVIGSNLSAMLAYVVGRYFGHSFLMRDEPTGALQRYALSMRQNSFQTVLLMRLLLLPYDVVNYFSGFLRINWRAYFAATAIGSFPVTLSLVLVGVSGDVDLSTGKFALNPWLLVASALLIGASLLLSRHFRNRARLRC